MKDRVGDLAPESGQRSTFNEPDLHHAMSEGVNEGRLLLLVARFRDVRDVARPGIGMIAYSAARTTGFGVVGPSHKRR
jgi:hypothetical protein